MSDTDLAPVTPAQIRPPKVKRLNKQKLMFLDLWSNPESKTFGNVYRSGLAAGFSPTYSRNIVNAAPSWLVSFMDKVNLEQEHIVQGIQSLALHAPNSKSPDDTRLKAYEMLMKIKGMGNDKQTVNLTVVQPILGGQAAPKKVDIDQ